MDSLTVCMAHGVRAACSHSGLKLSVIRHCWGVQCVMSLRCIIDRAACSQCDIDQSRPPGSSCCTLFCSRLAVNVLGRASPSTDFFSMSSLQELLLKAVRDWDRTNLVDGAPAHQVLLDCSRESSGFELDIEVQERFVSRCGLLDILATSGSGDFAILLTAIPETDGEHQQKCGKTCALFSLRDAVHLVDSHPRHPCGGGPAGMLHAYVEDSQVDLRSKVLCDWIWANDGFLKELRCNFDFVDITVFRNKRRTQAPTLTSPLRLSGRVSSSNSSGATSSQELVTPSRPTAPTSSTSGHSQYTPPPMQIIEEIDNHDQIHPTFVKSCAQCRWRRNGPRWVQQSSFRHPTTGQLVSPIAEKPASLPGPWGIGCVLCANHTSSSSAKQAFARFEVNSLATLQGTEIRRHCNSDFHKSALKALDESSALQAGSSASQAGSEEPDHLGVPGVEGVPRPDKFVWGITVCHAAGSDCDYQRFCKAAALTSYLSPGYLVSDAGRSACMKIISAVGGSLRDQHQRILRKAVRLAFSIDERDQVFVNRVRIVVCIPEVRAHKFVARVIRDYGNGSGECADAVRMSLRALCERLREKRNADNITGSADVFNEDLFKKLQDITFAGASDGAEVAIKGVQHLCLSGRLAMRKVYWIMEQPMGSLLWYMPAIKRAKRHYKLKTLNWQRRFLWLGHYGHSLLKPTELVGVFPGMESAWPTRRPAKRDVTSAYSQRINSQGRRRVDGRPGLKATEHYPPAFCDATASLIKLAVRGQAAR